MIGVSLQVDGIRYVISRSDVYSTCDCHAFELVQYVWSRTPVLSEDSVAGNAEAILWHAEHWEWFVLFSSVFKSGSLGVWGFPTDGPAFRPLVPRCEPPENVDRVMSSVGTELGQELTSLLQGDMKNRKSKPPSLKNCEYPGLSWQTS